MKCRSCRSEARPGWKTCERCYTRDREYQKKRRERRVRAGLCVKCGKNPSIKDRVTCSSCYKNRRKDKKGKARARYHQRKLKGLCVRCGEDAKGRTTCLACRKKKRIQDRRYKEERKIQGIVEYEDPPEVKECEVPGCTRMAPPFDIYCMHHLDGLTEMKEMMAYMRNRRDRQLPRY